MTAEKKPPVPPRILLAATLRWAFGARLAMAFRELGCTVEAWGPRGHPFEAVSGLATVHRARRPWQRSLRAALLAAAPDLVIPCDDDCTRLLRRIHARCRHDGLSELLERSLGRPASSARASARGELLELAKSLGVRTPAVARVESAAELAEWCGHHGWPAVLKADRSWGGHGVSVLRQAADLEPAIRAARRPAWRRVLADLLVRRDPAPVLERALGVPPALTVQGFVSGRAANRAVACWRGTVLGGISVEAVRTQGATGPASVVRVIEHPEMAEAARRIVRALGLSGFVGLDFVLDWARGDAYLIEVNPRATPTCHLARDGEPALPDLLLGRLRGTPVRAALAAPHDAARGDTIAIFPGEWRRDPHSPWLTTAFHDVPWSDPALVRDGLRDLWEDRGLVARLRARFRPEARTAALRQSSPPGGLAAPASRPS